MADNFERCLAITLKWEGGYSNHPDDPGGPTMKGVIQREYDSWRRRQAKHPRPVRQIEDDELRAIYRDEYWRAMGCDDLRAGMDLCVFDAAVNSGIGRAKHWLEEADDVDAFCNARLAFLQKLGRLWRVFGAGWHRRVEGIRRDAHLMEGKTVSITPHDGTLHAGMKGELIRKLQQKLRTLGYPCGAVDGIFGEQLHRAVILFQHDQGLIGNQGAWYPEYNERLETAEPMLPKRADTTVKDLERAGDRPTARMNFLQRIFAWLFGASAAAQAFSPDSVMDSVNGMRSILEPVQDVMDWLAGNRWLFVAAGCVAIIALVRVLRSEHLSAYQNFDYQGPSANQEKA